MKSYIKHLLSDEDGDPCTESHAGTVTLVVVIGMTVANVGWGVEVPLPVFNGLLMFTAAAFGLKGFSRVTIKKNRNK